MSYCHSIDISINNPLTLDTLSLITTAMEKMHCSFYDYDIEEYTTQNMPFTHQQLTVFIYDTLLKNEKAAFCLRLYNTQWVVFCYYTNNELSFHFLISGYAWKNEYIDDEYPQVDFQRYIRTLTLFFTNCTLTAVCTTTL